MNLELSILQTLDDASPRLLKFAVLEAETRLATGDLLASEFDRAISSLDRKRQIRLHPGEDVTRVAITDAGKERVASAK